MPDAARTIRSPWSALRSRSEALAGVVGYLMLSSMLAEAGQGARSPARLLLAGLALTYIGLVLCAPCSLPQRAPAPITRPAIRRAAALVVPAVLLSLVLMTVLRSVTGAQSSGGSRPGQLLAFLLAMLFGTLGLASAAALPVDLFPEARRLTLRRLLYLAVSAAFLAMMVQLAGGLFKNFGTGLDRALGASPPDDQALASGFDSSHPLALLLNMLIGAGFLEELWFRLGIMVPVWALTRRWGWGLLVSSVLFGLYHISPFSGLGQTNLAWPAAAVAGSIGAGLVNGLILRYRGFTAAVVTHGLGDWILLMLLARG